jgi:ABC-type multidrug transport system fused ATPase/permease subunit
MAALQTLAAGRTTLLITHRLVGLEEADEILVLRAGRIAERGRHHELMEMDGLYRHMWDLQNQILAKAPMTWTPGLEPGSDSAMDPNRRER